MVRGRGFRGVNGVELSDKGLGVDLHLLLESCKEGREVRPGLEAIGWLPAVNSGAVSLWAMEVHRPDLLEPDPCQAYDAHQRH